MQLYSLISVIIIILASTTVLEQVCAALDATPFALIFCALCVLCLSGFVYAPYPELRINIACAVLPICLLIMSGRETEHGILLPAMVVIVMSGTACIAEKLLGAGTGLITGVISGLAALCLGGGMLSLFVVCSVPIITQLMNCAYELAQTGYTSCNMGSIYILNAQMTALLVAMIIAVIKRIMIKRTSLI
ncbi:MAG: hypothetical protein RR232_01965 [Clostridia bacterium]